MNNRILILFIILLSFLPVSAISAQGSLKLSTGLSLGGTGIGGIPIQFRFANFMALNAGVYYRGIHVDEFEDKWFTGPAADLGFDIFLSHRENQNKFRKTEHGVYLKAGYGLHVKEEDGNERLKERSASLGWLMEVSGLNNPRSFLQVQLGPSLIQSYEGFLNKRYPPGYQLQTSERISAMIYFRISWFFLATR